MRTLGFCTLALLASAAAAQTTEQPVSPVPPSEAARPTGRTASVAYLMEQYGISEAEARERLAVQLEVMELSTRLHRENDPAYANLYTDHTPVFRVVIAFADNKDRRAFVQSLSPTLRRYVQVISVPKSRREVQLDLEALVTGLKGAGIDFTTGFDPRSRRYVVNVHTQQMANAARENIPPQLRDEVAIQIRPRLVPEAAPTGVQANDWIVGGFTFYHSKDPVKSSCTWGYPVRFGSPEKKGILTAGHCGDVAFHYYNNHWINFAPPVIRKHYETKYDYAIFESTGLTDDQTYEVYYNNVHGLNVSTRGYYQIYGWIGWESQNVGDTMCKSGKSTGLTCGQITNDNLWFNNSFGWIEVSHTKQPDLSAPGDSGGPWFMDPGTGYKAIAAGIHSTGSENCVGTGSACVAVYMPVEWIDDHDTTVRLVLSP